LLFSFKRPQSVLFKPCAASTLLLNSYLAGEARGDQGGHDDHGDNDLDGVGNGSHVECIVVVYECKRDEVSNYEMREGRIEGEREANPSNIKRTNGQSKFISPNLASLGTKIFSNFVAIITKFRL
jgi:hypothetical protein